MRQAHQRNMRVEREAFVFIVNQFDPTFERLHQADQRPSWREQHARAALLEQGQIAAELDYIAEALLVVNQNRLPGEVLSAEPQGLVESAISDRPLAEAPPF